MLKNPLNEHQGTFSKTCSPRKEHPKIHFGVHKVQHRSSGRISTSEYMEFANPMPWDESRDPDVGKQ